MQEKNKYKKKIAVIINVIKNLLLKKQDPSLTSLYSFLFLGLLSTRIRVTIRCACDVRVKTDAHGKVHGIDYRSQ